MAELLYDHTKVMLGCLPSRRDKRTLKLATYAAGLPKPPIEVRWDKIKPSNAWGVDGNNSAGNCVICCAAHMIDSAVANESDPNAPRISDSDVIALSRQMGAMNGYNVLDRLNYWRKNGMWGHKLQAFASVNLHNHDLVKFAINAFGSIDLAVNLPIAWQGTATWECGSGRSFNPGSWGGHSIPALGYDDKWLYMCTWGNIIPCSWDALDQYFDEQYAAILPEWFAKDAKSPSGFDSAALLADLSAIGDSPTFDPTPLPPPIVVPPDPNFPPLPPCPAPVDPVIVDPKPIVIPPHIDIATLLQIVLAILKFFAPKAGTAGSTLDHEEAMHLAVLHYDAIVAIAAELQCSILDAVGEWQRRNPAVCGGPVRDAGRSIDQLASALHDKGVDVTIRPDGLHIGVGK